jgi:hypothetical protein
VQATKVLSKSRGSFTGRKGSCVGRGDVMWWVECPICKTIGTGGGKEQLGASLSNSQQF